MIERLGFLYFLLTLWVCNTKEYGGVKEDNRANPESSQNNASCLNLVKDIKISSPTQEITIGANVTVVCYWETNCLPISYILFLNKGRVQGPAAQSTKEQNVLFNITIHSNSQLGPYKCKANTTYGTAYGPSFNFTLKENNLAVFIVPPLIFLLLLIVAVVTIRLLIFPWYKARKLKSANICTAYGDTEYETIEYCHLKMKPMTDDRYVNNNGSRTAAYAEVVCK